MPTGLYGAVSWLERIHTILVLLPLPFVTLSRLLLSPFLSSEKHKTWRRVLADASFRYISSSMRVNEMQNVMGTTGGVYETWARKNGVEVRIDEIGEDARLLWFTERRLTVVLYVHGGTYCLPLQDFAASFWKDTIESIEKSTGNQVGVVALNYTLIPEAYFPTQLAQLVCAIEFLQSRGVASKDIHLVGESAGGALILQLLSHMLHPFPPDQIHILPSQSESRRLDVKVACLSKGIKLGSACIMSPWVSISGTTGSHVANSSKDVLPAHTWAYLGEQNLPSLECLGSQEPDKATVRPYLEALKAPERWWDGLERVVGRVFVSVGENECLRDDVLEVAGKLGGEERPDLVTTVVQKNGVHNDQYLDVMAGETRQGELTLKIIEWMKESLAGGVYSL